jgi:hypothetical protein
MQRLHDRGRVALSYSLAGKRIRESRRERNMKKRILSVLLTVCMVLTMMPALGKTTEVSAEDEKFSRILNVATTIPNGYNESDTSNPYMKVKDRSFLLNKQDELLLYTQWDDGGTTRGTVQQNIMDTYYTYNKEKGTTSTVPKDTDSYKESNSVAAYTNPSTEGTTTSTDLNNMAYVTGIAFDPNGTGHKDHVAYVGLDTKSRNKETPTYAIVTWVLDTTTINVFK